MVSELFQVLKWISANPRGTTGRRAKYGVSPAISERSARFSPVFHFDAF
jgi:hypothetical protein